MALAKPFNGSTYCMLKSSIKLKRQKLFEWDKLDHAVGGANQALGTKLHQQTHKAIAKRQPALMTAIRKFNSYCEHLESIYDPSWGIPLPTPLPTKLADLRNDQTLMEDVWITPSVGNVPHWMEDADEEQRRLGLEADNLCRWFGDELAALELALRSPAMLNSEDQTFLFTIQQRRDHVLQLQTRWVTPLASATHFTSNGNAALKLAIALSGNQGSSTAAPYSLIPTSLTLADPSPEEDTSEESTLHAFEEAAEQAALSDVLQDGAIGDDDEEDTSSMGEPEFIIIWELPEVFEPRDMSILAQPTLTIHILTTSHVHPCAIFPTHNLPCIRYNASNDILWRNTLWMSYWEKDLWLIPIHRPSPVGHWVFCAVYTSTKELHLFDSFADKQPWKNDVKVSIISNCAMLNSQ
ncbi:hypothetical protein DFH29DRAFT_985177 [Suillus ampliporus]|nr:hypothetical protein DFH29DRAFT_985177 [Suillus ampliporus]